MKYIISAIAFALFAISFISLSFWISSGNAIQLDSSANSMMASMENDVSTGIANVFDIVFDTIPVLLLTSVFSVLVWKMKKRKEALFIITTMILLSIAVLSSKEIIHSARPMNGIANGNGFAFPSGHTAGSFALLGSLLFIAWKGLKTDGKFMLSLFFISSVLAVGFSRIYLNVHWLSDVIGGYLLGAACLLFMIYFYEIADWKSLVKKVEHYAH